MPGPRASRLTFEHPLGLEAGDEDRRLGRRMLPVHPEVRPGHREGLLGQRLPLGGFPQLRPDDPELVVPELEQIELRERPPADIDRLLRCAGADVEPEEVEEVEKGGMVILMMKVTCDDLLEQSLRLLRTA